MKDTGITRRVDPLGRVILPIELRRTMEISPGDLMGIFAKDSSVILKKYIDTEVCVFCGFLEKDDNMEIFHGKKICHMCLRDFRDE